jgi:peptidyl-dipeptidase A
MKTSFQPTLIAVLVAGALLGCQPASKPAADTPVAPAQAAAPTAEEAKAFVAKASEQTRKLLLEVNRADWIANTYITEDTEALSADYNKKLTEAVVALANEAARFNDTQVDADTRRQLDKLKLALTLAAPKDPAKTD